MEKKELMYEGKAKKVYSTDDPALCIVSYKDDATAFNGEKKGTIVGKGVVNNRMSNFMFQLLEKNGIPTDADLVFDVRFLPNPYYIEELKNLTGNDKPVSDYVLSFPQTNEFRKMLVDMISYLIPYYVDEGKNQLVIAIGCTGGQHRSVTITNCLYDDLKGHGDYALKIFHRDAKKKTRDNEEQS